jgi:hypothetical protein
MGDDEKAQLRIIGLGKFRGGVMGAAKAIFSAAQIEFHV